MVFMLQSEFVSQMRMGIVSTEGEVTRFLSGKAVSFRNYGIKHDALNDCQQRKDRGKFCGSGRVYSRIVKIRKAVVY